MGRFKENQRQNQRSEVKNLMKIIAGVDEVGRGSLIGPVYASAVSRDKFITTLSKKNKGYDWDKNFGYGTKQHLKALKKLGITKHHRKTFSPISKIN